MSDIAPNSITTPVGHGQDAHGDGHAGGHAHNPHLAHHFDTPEQQFDSGKLGMWTFLATEILMFGGLFCAYAVYRHNHSDVFQFAHHFLNKTLGGVNTVVLITSSLTMAWAVRASQLGQIKLLIWLLAITIVGGAAFMAIKTIEYEHKYHEHVWVGNGNYFSKNFSGDKSAPVPGESHGSAMTPGGTPIHGGAVAPATAPASAPSAAASSAHSPAPVAAAPVHQATVTMGASSGSTAKATASPEQNLSYPSPAYVDPNANTGDAVKIAPVYTASSGLTAQARKSGGLHADIEHKAPVFAQLPVLDQERVNSFFSIYYVMTGLHGVHVLVGMALIFWILLRSIAPQQRRWVLPAGPMLIALLVVFAGAIIHHSPTLVAGIVLTVGCALWAAGAYFTARPATTAGEFGPDYYTPVDLVGLYWHIVDLIWIFLFPLLYLIG